MPSDLNDILLDIFTDGVHLLERYSKLEATKSSTGIGAMSVRWMVQKGVDGELSTFCLVRPTEPFEGRPDPLMTWTLSEISAEPEATSFHARQFSMLNKDGQMRLEWFFAENLSDPEDLLKSAHENRAVISGDDKLDFADTLLSEAVLEGLMESITVGLKYHDFLSGDLDSH